MLICLFYHMNEKRVYKSRVNGDISLIHLLLEYNEPKQTWLHVAAYYEYFDLIQNMLKGK
jgi:hypothetical protein